MALSVDVDVCDGTAQGGLLLHAASVCQRLTFGKIGEFGEKRPTLIGRGCASGSRHRERAVDLSDDNQLQCAILLGSGGCDRGWRYG